MTGVWPYSNDGKLNMSYVDGHVVTWKWQRGSEIWPTAGNGLWTRQKGFWWWANKSWN